MVDSINVGLIGFGTVGSGVAKILLEKRSELKQRTGMDFVLKKVCDKDISGKRAVVVPKELLTANVKDVLENKEIDIVVELIGGIHPAKEFISTALKNGKHVVTANKALLAEEGKELFELAREKNLALGYEASVCGGIPIIKALREGLVANEVKEIFGIVNGTCNYILTKMALEKMSFNDALKIAQEKGFAEANPAFDIEGKDSMHKAVLLALTAHGVQVSAKDVYTEGITKITQKDIEFSSELGYCIKLLAIIKKSDGEIELRVHPTMIPKEYLLASVIKEFNAVYVRGDAVGSTIFYGKGAGMMPTASAVVADIVEIGQKISTNSSNFSRAEFKALKVKSMNEIESCYYLRFSVEDKPGVIAKISKILGDNKISIASVIQKEENMENVPLILITHKTIEGNLQKAVKEIDKLDCIKAKTMAIRVEHD